jgi:hypothetical protein
MIKLVSTILILLGISAVSALGQMPTPEPLSYADRAAIVITVLEPPPTSFSLSNQFKFILLKTVSSDNLEFVDSSQLEKHGIRLVSASSLREAQKENVVDYSLFRKFSFRDGAAIVTLAQVTEGRPCFAAHMHHELSYTYEVRRTSNGLVVKLIRGPAPMMSLDWKRFATR